MIFCTNTWFLKRQWYHCVHWWMLQVIGFLLFLADGDKVNINKLKQTKQLNLCPIDAIFKVSQPSDYQPSDTLQWMAVVTLLRHVRIAESEPYCHSILFVCLSVGHSATYSLPRLTDHNHIWSAGIYLSSDPCKPFWIPVSHTLGARGKNMQNFTYFQRVFLPLRTWCIVPYDLL